MNSKIDKIAKERDISKLAEMVDMDFCTERGGVGNLRRRKKLVAQQLEKLGLKKQKKPTIPFKEQKKHREIQKKKREDERQFEERKKKKKRRF